MENQSRERFLKQDTIDTNHKKQSDKLDYIKILKNVASKNMVKNEDNYRLKEGMANCKQTRSIWG